ncbi:MAG: thioredoxin family protein [Proteobacteria bacterium]|nr:thioredoxin family protein [Pseudomonadota bacterium]
MIASGVICDFDWPAPDFRLLGTDGVFYERSNIMGSNGLLVMFICNHCPYVLGALDRLIETSADLQSKGIGVGAISSNDVNSYPEDSFENMTKLAKEYKFRFPYLYDETQEVARAYRAVCTPDFFGFNKNFGLQYRGRLDSTSNASVSQEIKRELYEGMLQIAETGLGPKDQVASIGCSIKWKG